MSLLRPPAETRAPGPASSTFETSSLSQNEAIGLHEFFIRNSVIYRKAAETIKAAISQAAISQGRWDPFLHMNDLPLASDITPPRMPFFSPPDQRKGLVSFKISPAGGTETWMKNLEETFYHQNLVRSILLYVYPATLRKIRCHLICSIQYNWSGGVRIQKFCVCAPIIPSESQMLIDAYESAMGTDRPRYFHVVFPNFLDLLKKVLKKDRRMRRIPILLTSWLTSPRSFSWLQNNHNASADRNYFGLKLPK